MKDTLRLFNHLNTELSRSAPAPRRIDIARDEETGGLLIVAEWIIKGQAYRYGQKFPADSIINIVDDESLVDGFIRNCRQSILSVTGN